MENPASHRLKVLEEHVGFIEHAMSGMSDQVASLDRRLADILRRLSLLEMRCETAPEHRPDETGPKG